MRSDSGASGACGRANTRAAWRRVCSPGGGVLQPSHARGVPPQQQQTAPSSTSHPATPPLPRASPQLEEACKPPCVKALLAYQARSVPRTRPPDPALRALILRGQCRGARTAVPPREVRRGARPCSRVCVGVLGEGVQTGGALGGCTLRPGPTPRAAVRLARRPPARAAHDAHGTREPPLVPTLSLPAPLSAHPCAAPTAAAACALAALGRRRVARPRPASRSRIVPAATTLPTQRPAALPGPRRGRESAPPSPTMLTLAGRRASAEVHRAHRRRGGRALHRPVLRLLGMR